VASLDGFLRAQEHAAARAAATGPPRRVAYPRPVPRPAQRPAPPAKPSWLTPYKEHTK
jgi:hypothetical protein